MITQLPGNAPEEIERRVTVPLERELNGTPGMTLMRSESLFGLSLITMTFADDVSTFRRAHDRPAAHGGGRAAAGGDARSSRPKRRRSARSTSSA